MVMESEHVEEDWKNIDDIYLDKPVGQLQENDELSEEEGFVVGYNREEDYGFITGYGGV